MKSHPFFWRAEFIACSCAAFILVPMSLASTWLARKAMRGQERAEIQLLHTTAMRRTQAERTTPRAAA